MASKLFVSFVLLAVLVLGLTWGISHSQSMDQLSDDLRTAQTALESTETGIKSVRERITAREEVNQLLATLDELTAKSDKLKLEVDNLKRSIPPLADRKREAIQAVRAKSVGMTFPELTLANGTRLRNAKLQRLTEETATFQHLDGVTNARDVDLPHELRERFLLGEAAEKKPLGELAASTAAEEAKKAKLEAEHQEKVEQHEKKVLEANLQIERMGNDLRLLTEAAAAAETAASTATSATQKYQTKLRRDQLNAQVVAMRRALDNARIEYKRLEAAKPVGPRP